MSQPKHLTKISKFMSYVLRHAPESLGLTLDARGFVNVELLVSRHNAKSAQQFTVDQLYEVVATCDKQRYELSEDRTMIRAAQGHSIDVELGLEEREPPEVLYHGTAERFYHSITVSGISKMQRQHVHLSADVQTAMTVGARHGHPLIFKINAQRMHADGVKFWISANGVWFVDHVDPKYLFKVVRENA